MKSKKSRSDQLSAAVRMAELGDFEAARRAFSALLATDRRSAGLHYNLALVEENVGNVETAAALQSRALALDPKMGLAARRLARLLTGFQLSRSPVLENQGLTAALGHAEIAHQAIAEAVLTRALLVDGTLAQALKAFEGGANPAAAVATVLGQTHEGWRAPGVLKALAAGVVRNPEIERFLTTVRWSLLLDVPPARFEDRSLYALALALVAAAQNGDFAWAEAADETAALAARPLDLARLSQGDVSAALVLLHHMLYRPLLSLVPLDDAAALARKIRPKALGEAVGATLAPAVEEHAIARALPRLCPFTDATTKRVADQYEASPYPRWKTATLRGPDQLRPTLQGYFANDELSFLSRPFDVLIAGAGTGQQVAQSAALFGPTARVLAIDISAASLAYAKRMATRLGLTHVEFMLADILDLDRLERSFDIVDCVGVLHHMGDPWAGWRALLRRMKPGGLARIGLYSSISRANLRQLRTEPDYPGPGCSDAAARAWRATLLTRPEGAPGSETRVSNNFHNLNEFRDLALHVNEHQMSLPEIGRFLVDNDVRFAGFVLPDDVKAQFRARFRASSAGVAGAGTLEDWHRFEMDNPRTFDAMYCFWTRKE